ncbi:ABC transporter permease [Maribacter polysaccharolyticus]|uniref:ABC transporter permease n=1 Tax=Maribacter polysaccharolyticus TaxID=3020831 RepID=UPI00237F0506|nr:FtsX-like permease family protein [Maribacter polysaccharolyticus]MDE3741923.1 ABC transporter permease [Maribacter polysaccharolyticus]
MAWRDGKASSRRLVLFMASIVLGIAAVVSIQSFSDNLQRNITTQSKELMGADYLIDSNDLPNGKVQAIIDSLGGEAGREVKFASMATFSKGKATKLVQIRGIEGDYPLYGTLETEPVKVANDYQEEGAALVDATLMLQFDLHPGDSVKVGNLTFPIAGALLSAPGSSAISSTVAPPIIIPFRFVEETGLLQKGSRIEYDYYFLADGKTDLEELNKVVDPLLDAQNADLDTHIDTSRRLGRRYENMGKFLNMVAFIALLLGCLGIASSVHIYIKEKLRALAILKCLGATGKQTFLIYLIQIAGMGFVGGLLGTALGIGLQFVFPMFLQDFLPFEIEISLALKPILTGLFLGIFMSVLFALSPLLVTWYVSPLVVLRIGEVDNSKSVKAMAIVGMVILISVLFLAYGLLQRWTYALAFVLGIVLTFGILAGFAKLSMGLIKKYFPLSWGFTARQSLLNLFRPNNQTMVLILAIGVGSFLVSTLYFTKEILLSKTTLENRSGNPNIILFDVQTEQKDEVANSITSRDLRLIDNIPIVTMRVQSINGRPVNDIRLDSTSQVHQWILNHEFRVTYRDSLMASEQLLEGEWMPKMHSEGPIPISISDNVARDAKVGVGDTLEFNVQGVLMETVVGNIRAVDWGQMQLNFSIVFPKGVLENAPQFHVLTTNVPDTEGSARLQKEMVSRFPNVSIIDLRQVIGVIEGILDKISWAINFMAFFSILTGVIVLIGAVRNSKYQRIRDNVLLRTLGARSIQILRITALEYLYLGLLGSGIGIVLSLLGSGLMAVFVFETPFIPTMEPFLVLVPGITLLVLSIGLFNSRGVISSPPLQVLRKEVR